MSDLQQIHEAVLDLRKKSELIETAKNDEKQKNISYGELEQQIKNISDFLDKHEEKSQKMFLEQQKAQKSQEDMLAKYENLLVESRRLGSAGESVNTELKNFDLQLRGDQKAIRTDILSLGGFAVPESFSNQVIRKLTEVSPMRTICTTATMPAKSESVPIVNSIVGGGFYGEGVEIPVDTQMSGGNVRFIARRQGVVAVASNEEVQDASFDLVGEIQKQVIERFAKDEGVAALTGTDPYSFDGILTNSGVGFIKSGSNTGITFDSLIDLTGEIESFYTPIYVFNSRTLAHIRRLKDGAQQYIWQQGNLGAGLPNSINGIPYVIMPDMPNVATGSFPVLYGDFRQYKIADRREMNVIVDINTFSVKGQIRYVFNKRVAGGVIRPEAFVKLKIEQ